MKRKIVKHGPSTLTISLPAKWIRENGISRGDEINLERYNQGLFLTTDKGLQFKQKSLNVRNLKHITAKAVAALYKRGYDEIILHYDTLDELETIHRTLNIGFIGFEIVRETEGEVWIRKVSEPSKEEFKTLFRRIFYFLLSVADEGLEAAHKHDKSMYQRLILRDNNINRLSDFCRRIVNKRGQTEYGCETALYHIIEQLEKVGDCFKQLSKHLEKQQQKPSREILQVWKDLNGQLRMFEELFFRFNVQRADEFMGVCMHFYTSTMAMNNKIKPHESEMLFILGAISKNLYDLTGATMIMHL